MKKYFNCFSFVFLFVVIFVITLNYQNVLCYNFTFLSGLLTPIIGLVAISISYHQYKNSKEQKIIALDKHRLDLFEKRFEVYQLFLDMSLQCYKIYIVERSEFDTKAGKIKEEENLKYIKFIDENENKLISFGEGARFTFDDDVKSLLDEARRNIINKRDFIKKLNEARKEKGATKSFISDSNDIYEDQYIKIIIDSNKHLRSFFEKRLPDIMDPFLNLKSYKY